MTKSIMDLVAEAKSVVPDISPEEVKPLMGRQDVLIVDVRDDGEVASTGKVQGAVHAPLPFLAGPFNWRSPGSPRHGCGR